VFTNVLGRECWVSPFFATALPSARTPPPPAPVKLAESVDPACGCANEKPPTSSRDIGGSHFIQKAGEGIRTLDVQLGRTGRWPPEKLKRH
jgi:hypothetical protein